MTCRHLRFGTILYPPDQHDIATGDSRGHDRFNIHSAERAFVDERPMLPGVSCFKKSRQRPADI